MSLSTESSGMAASIQMHPFGEAGCEDEVTLLGDEFKNYYFHNTRFSQAAMDPSTFLIIGRRGAGKTALSQFFLFQNSIKNAVAIDIKEPDLFQSVLNKLSSLADKNREVAVPRIAKIWEVAIWAVIFREFRHESPLIEAACIFGDQAGGVAEFIKHLFKSLLNRFVSKDEELLDEFESLIADDRIKKAKEIIIETSKHRPIILAFDTLENYTLNDESMMRAVAALVQFASDFNRSYAMRGIHLKLFIMAEVFPHLKQEVILNPLKTIRNEIYLSWRPKDLLRLICWRFYKYLKHQGYNVPSEKSINWDNYSDVLNKMWNPYFGEFIKTKVGQIEQTFPYVLRHTQLRPRQLIVLCNNIAKNSQVANRFPNFTPEDIIEGVQKGEMDLADEVCNAYSSVYPNAGKIIEALSGLPMIFTGKELDRRAPETAAAWHRGDYSSLNFRQLVAELGIIGRIRHKVNADGNDKCGEADFEYAINQRLPLLVDTQCAVHPMFYQRLNISVKSDYCIYPFPDHEEFHPLNFRQS